MQSIEFTPALVAVLSLMAASVCAAADRNFERTVSADPKGSVRVSNVSGTVSVSGWDKQQVEVKGRLSGNVERVDVLSDKGRTTIRVVVPRNMTGDGEADLEIRVPSGSDVDVSAVSADVDVSRVTGPQRLTTVSGEIRSEFAQNLEGKTVSGDMRLKGDGKTGELHLSSVSGDIALERGAGELDATSVSGDLVLELGAATSARLRTTSGNMTLRGALARDGSVEADTISGDVTLHLKADAGYAYEASSFSGDIGNCFGAHAERVSAHGPGSRLMGSMGDGKGRIRVKSMSGDVALCDR
jgi:DUF4097 and DUF4098 domain-containing protein YvlB